MEALLRYVIFVETYMFLKHFNYFLASSSVFAKSSGISSLSSEVFIWRSASDNFSLEAAAEFYNSAFSAK